MGDKTPTKRGQALIGGFSPVNLPDSPAAGSPHKHLTGLARVVRDLVADIYNTVQRWNEAHVKGALLVKQIASIKAENPGDFSQGLEQLTRDLYDLVQGLKQGSCALGQFSNQMGATAKLQRTSQPVFISLHLTTITRLVEEINQAYSDELKVKELILENAAHATNKDEAMFFAALWAYQYKIPDSINFKLETLLIETGHRKIT